MAITITSQPYSFTPRGQRLMFIATSDNVANDQFKYGVKVTATSTGQVFQFLLSADPSGYLVFDLQSVVKLRNEDSLTGWHSSDFSDYQVEPLGKGWEEYVVQLQEWWMISAVLTENEAAREDVTLNVFNASLQPSYGYLPNVDSTDEAYSFALGTTTAQVLTDRVVDTHNWWKADSFPIGGNVAVYIPALNSDYGLLSFTPTEDYTLNAPPYSATYSIFNAVGMSYSATLSVTETNGIIHIPCYPKNLSNDGSLTATPANTTEWRYYTITLKDSSNATASIRYCFYNAEVWGQFDCRYDRVRLGWVNSRGGWDYFNFIKKNEYTSSIERKQYRKVLYRNPTEVFLPADRQLHDRDNIVTRSLTITSDWVQEEEYVFLKNLFYSNQVQIINDDGTQTPVSVTDTSFTEKKERNGKKYNVTLTITLSQDYWL
jgi:hypothetical protein